MVTVLLLFVLCTNSATSLSDASPRFDGFLRNASDGTLEAYMIQPFPSNHASFIQQCPNGDLVMAWFSGAKEGTSGVAIVVSRLPRGSLQWTNASLVSQRQNYSNQNPVLFFDSQSGTLYLFHTQQDAKIGEGSATIWELQSTDCGIKWTIPRIMLRKPGSFDRNRIVVSLNNTWLYPAYQSGMFERSYLMENTNHKVCDKWKKHYFTGSEHLVQPTVIRPVGNSTNLISFFRDKRAQYIYRATSSDDGVTWSRPSKTTLPNNDSGIQATVLNSGRIAMVYNPTNRVRNPLVISISEDEGLTWVHTRVLEVANVTNHVEFSYPSLFQDSCGRIHVSYTYNRDTIKHKIIPNEAWIHN